MMQTAGGEGKFDSLAPVASEIHIAITWTKCVMLHLLSQSFKEISEGDLFR